MVVPAVLLALRRTGPRSDQMHLPLRNQAPGGMRRQPPIWLRLDETGLPGFDQTAPGNPQTALEVSRARRQQAVRRHRIRRKQKRDLAQPANCTVAANGEKPLSNGTTVPL